ncbi:MAG: hypothetical protein RQ899_00680 [Pseudomonadales bacterium]|nr:hypothetical protein [Pseudomonadales bacterium]
MLPAEEEEASPETFDGDIPIELVRYFTGGGNMRNDLPADFPAIEIPQGLRLAGANDLGGGRQVVVFSTSLGEREAQEALIEVFLAREGWQEWENSYIVPPGIFVPPSNQASANRTGYASRELCHDQLGLLRFQFLPENGTLSVSRTPVDRRPAASYCERQREREQRANFRSRDTGPLASILPQLALPEGGLSRGGSGGNEERRADALLINPAYSLAELALHFAPQFEAQGWRLDAEGDGELSIGQSWVREMPGDRSALAFLNLVEHAQGTFEILFRARLAR